MTEDFLELIARWEEWNMQRGTNLINVEPMVTEVAQLSNINIVTHGGKNIGVDQGAPNQPTII